VKKREVKLQIELEAILDKKFRLFEDTIQTQIEDIFLRFMSQLQTMEVRIQEMEKKKKINPRRRG
jgi:hypothetical protein